MDYLTISRWSIPVVWLAFFGAIFYLEYRMKNEHETTVKLIDRLIWHYLIVWKLSYIIFSFDNFIAAPTSLLYFDGGVYGHVLALLTIGVTILLKRKELDMPTLLQAWVQFVSAYHVIYYVFAAEWRLLLVWLPLLLLGRKINIHLLITLQWFFILWVNGWQSYFVYSFAFMLIIDLLHTKKAQLLAFVGLASLVALTVAGLDFKEQQTAREEIQLTTMADDMYRVSEQKEDYIIVNFFATWCLPCNAEMPHLQSFAENLPDNTQMIGVNLTKRDNGEQALQDFINKFSVTFPILLDKEDYFGKNYGVISIPTTVILKNGKEIQRFVGPVSEKQLRKIVEM